MDNNGRVAIVDDEAQLVRTYELLFKKRQIPMAFSASSGGEAVEKFRNAAPRPKVIIIDHRLPDMSGLEVMREILAMEPRTKVVFISGDEGARQGSLEAGAKAFMKKPASIKEITDTINSLMNA